MFFKKKDMMPGERFERQAVVNKERDNHVGAAKQK